MFAFRLEQNRGSSIGSYNFAPEMCDRIPAVTSTRLQVESSVALNVRTRLIWKSRLHCHYPTMLDFTRVYCIRTACFIATFALLFFNIIFVHQRLQAFETIIIITIIL